MLSVLTCNFVWKKIVNLLKTQEKVAQCCRQSRCDDGGSAIHTIYDALEEKTVISDMILLSKLISRR